MPKILSMKYVEDVTIPHASTYADHWEGVEVQMTGDHTLYVVIDNEQQCCERSGCQLMENEGYVDIPPDWQTFVGAEYLGIHTDSRYDDDDYATRNMFVDIMTDMGTATIHLYNAHNGYYGHACRVFMVKPEHETERRGMHTVVTKQMKVTALHSATL